MTEVTTSLNQSDFSVDVTQLLIGMRDGDRGALDQLMPAVYDRLRHLAHMQLSGERPNHTLHTTALVHEAYFKLVRHHEVDWRDRSHFFAVASRAMRQVLIEYARTNGAQKRGGDAVKLSLEDLTLRAPQRTDVLLALDEVLTRLERIDARQCRVVEYRFFGGMNIEETAAALSVSPSTVKRDWRTARAWIYREVRRLMA